eukprot:5061307-Pleurochrysis_carterae.AAC.2
MRGGQAWRCTMLRLCGHAVRIPLTAHPALLSRDPLPAGCVERARVRRAGQTSAQPSPRSDLAPSIHAPAQTSVSFSSRPQHTPPGLLLSTPF